MGRSTSIKITLNLMIFVSVLGHSLGLIHLDKYNITADSVTVSRISSGAAMATQMHVIHSKDISGAALFAGVPYFCALNTLAESLICMDTPALASVALLIADTNIYSATFQIDNTNNLIGDNAYVFAGSLDSVVNPGNGPNIEEFYQNYGVNVKTEYGIAAEHCQPTASYGPGCSYLGGEYINDCSFNGAFEALDHLYGGGLYPGVTATGTFDEFDQGDFFLVSLPSASSMDSRGYIYIPTECQDKTIPCKLHVAFHGCSQAREKVGTSFVMNSGYLEVAEANNIIVLFPQAVKTVLVNPYGCWDWWGYTNYLYPTSAGNQPTALFRMIDTLVNG